jgi:two-component system, OmpR family, response regulator ResD
MPKQVLVVDDEDKIREVITSYLDREGFQCIEARTGNEAIKQFQHHEIDLIILDLMLPDLSGESVCQIIRQSSEVPIIMLTAKSAEDSKINGLTIGADDYITKPFSPKELVARVKVLFRRISNSKNSVEGPIQFGTLVINQNSFQVTRNGETVPLTPKEFQLLLQMAKSPGRAFRRDDLIETVFGFDYEGDTRSIDQHIKNLRSKIEVDPKDPKFIKTVFGVGYQFTGGV